MNRSTARRAALLFLPALGGAAVALALAAHVRVPIGPFDTTLTARPGPTGETVVRLAPLGTVRLDTHDAPFELEARVEELRREEAEAIARDPAVLAGIEDELADDLRAGLRGLLARAALAAVVGGALAALLATRSWRAGAAGAGVGLATVAAAAGLAAATWRPQAVAEPRYTGLLTLAPRAVGDARDLAERFGEYRAQLAELVGNTVTLYRAAEDLPTYAPADDTVRVLHVSDVHLNPQAYDLMAQVVRGFEIDAVVDTGDTTDWGTEPEGRLVERIAGLGVPYVWVRGNHDSGATQEAVRSQPNAVVLDGQAADVAGLRFFGVGDPRYTPDKDEATGDEAEREAAAAFAPELARRLAAAEPPAVDVLAVHDPRMAARSHGAVPLVLAGHTHRHRIERRGATVVLTQGSTGGAGLRALRGDTPTPLSCAVLYFDRQSRALLAYDQVTVSGLGGTDTRIARHVVRADDRPAGGARPTGDSAARLLVPSGHSEGE